MDKYAVVTGGTKGIGYGIVEKLYTEGFNVAALGRTPSEDLKKLMAKSNNTNNKVKFIYVDISDLESINNSIDDVLKEFPFIDLHVNNAGVAPKRRLDILETTLESVDYILNINLKGTFFMTQKVANIMIKQRRKLSKIINISSMSAYTSSVNRGEYCISKAGISMITKLFADRLAEDNIFVYEVRPGIIKTDMTNSVTKKYDKDIENGLFPIKRWGYPKDVGNVVYALSLPEFSYSTGDIINVDGGFHVRRI